jgi:hypothetical protein
MLCITALDIQGALIKDQIPIRDFQNVQQGRCLCSVIGEKTSIRTFHRVHNAVPNQVLHDLAQKMTWYVKAFRKFLQADPFFLPSVNRYKGRSTECVSERF